MAAGLDDAEWRAFDPPFEHGEVELRAANIEGQFTAEQLRDHD